MADCEDCIRLRDHIIRKANRQDTTSGLEKALGWNRHKIGTHIRHLERGGELVEGRLGRSPNHSLTVEQRCGRERWHHVLCTDEDRELGASALLRLTEDSLFVFEVVPPRASSRRAHGVADLLHLRRARGFPRAAEGAETFGAYCRRLRGLRLEVRMNDDGTVERELLRVVRSEAAEVR